MTAAALIDDFDLARAKTARTAFYGWPLAFTLRTIFILERIAIALLAGLSHCCLRRGRWLW